MQLRSRGTYAAARDSSQYSTGFHPSIHATTTCTCGIILLRRYVRSALLAMRFKLLASVAFDSSRAWQLLGFS